MSRRSSSAATIHEINRAARSLLPDPLIRALNLTPSAEEKATLTELLADENKKLDFSKIMDYQDRNKRPVRLRQVAGMKLQQTFLHKFKDDKTEERLPYSALSEDEKNSFALALMMPALDVMRRFFLVPPPDYLTEMDSVVLKGGPYIDENGKSMYSLVLHLPNKKGEQVVRTGMFGLTYKSP